MILLIFNENSSIRSTRGGFVSFDEARSEAMIPICVCSPIAVTTPTARPFVIIEPA